MNYFELYPGDYLRDTTRLSLAEHGAYLRLLMAYYAEEQPLPEDLGELYVIVSAVSAGDKAAVKKVADRFFPVGDDGLRRNGRADAEIAKAQKRIETARANGSKGGRKPNPAGNPPGNPAGNPAGSQNRTQRDTQRGTHSGEALHTPHATRRTLPPDDVTPTAPSAAVSGQFEGHDRAARGANPAAQHAIALNRLGHRCTAMNPDLVAFVEAGGTVQHLEQVAALPECEGKPAAYVIRIARREHAEQAKPIAITNTPQRGSGQPSKTLQGITSLENLIRGHESELAPDRNRAGVAEALPALPRSISGNGRD